LFKHASLESVKAALNHPPFAALPLHARIQRRLRSLMLDGALAPGSALPASRRLAQSLGVSRDTVEAAYGALHAEGFIERRIGSGSVVSAQVKRLPTRPLPITTGGTPTLSQRGQQLLASGGLRDFVLPRPFAPGMPETRQFPLALWERLQRQALKEYGSSALLHSPPQGLAVLRRAIAAYANLERGARTTPEQVLVLTSSQQALTLCATVLLDAGERLLIEEPVYSGARKAFEAAGIHCVPIAVDADGMPMAHLPSARAVFLTPSHQYPSGATLSLERRLAVIDWALQHQAWIIEDDYDSEFHYQGKPTPCVQGLDPYQRTIYIGTFSKSLFPGLRIGYLLLPPALVEPMRIARTLLDGHSAPLAQLTLARFIEGGHFAAHIRSMRALYGERREHLAHLLKEHLGDFLQASVPAGGLQMPCTLQGGLTEQAVVQDAQSIGIDLLGLSTLYATHQKRSGFVLGFAAHTEQEMQTATLQLAKRLGHYKG